MTPHDLRLGPIVREVLRGARWMLLDLRESHRVEFKPDVWDTFCCGGFGNGGIIQFGEHCIEHMARGLPDDQFWHVTRRTRLLPKEAIAQLICHEIAHIYERGELADHGPIFQRVAHNLWSIYGERLTTRFEKFYKEAK